MHVPLDKSTRRPTGFAFVQFYDSAHAAAALAALDAKTFQVRHPFRCVGSALTVSPILRVL